MPDEQFSNLTRQKIAILIDGDNATPSLLPQMLDRGRKIRISDRPTNIRRLDNLQHEWVEGNPIFTPFNLSNSFDTQSGKHRQRMIIDAMDIMHSGVVDGFCLVSSDSDYTRLATRIRETGIYVMGIGEKKTPKPFVNACDVFVYTENLVAEVKAARTRSQKRKTETKKKGELDPMPVLTQAFEMAVREDGWARLDMMGNALYQLDPGFDPRSYGQRQLSRLVGNLKDEFEMRSQEIDGSFFFVKIKNRNFQIQDYFAAKRTVSAPSFYIMELVTVGLVSPLDISL
jgi:hypothetical protein